MTIKRAFAPIPTAGATGLHAGNTVLALRTSLQVPWQAITLLSANRAGPLPESYLERLPNRATRAGHDAYGRLHKHLHRR
jgi:hypothetical protein